MIYADLITGHTVSFEKTEQGWQNVGGENGRFALSSDTLHNEWHIKDYKTHQTYVYNAAGLLVSIEDCNHQKTTYDTENRVLTVSYNKGDKLNDFTIGQYICISLKSDFLTA